MAFKRTRWTAANILPVAFILIVIGTIWALYVWFHLRRLLSSSDNSTFIRGVLQAVACHIFTVLVMICFYRAVNTDPGSVPPDGAWTINVAAPKQLVFNMKGEQPDGGNTPGKNTRESKKNGQQRFCKWCDSYKPDRCHHCRTCNSCILRMDHHCPWICNCVGFRNYKFFFLLVSYAMQTCIFVCCTLWESVAYVAQEEVGIETRFLTVCCMVFSMIMAGLLVVFFAIHVTLLVRGTTTIEQCELSTKKPDSVVNYNLGAYANVCAALGPNPFLWFHPVDNIEGDGLSFKRCDPNTHAGPASGPGAGARINSMTSDDSSGVDTVEHGQVLLTNGH